MPADVRVDAGEARGRLTDDPLVGRRLLLLCLLRPLHDRPRRHPRPPTRPRTEPDRAAGRRPDRHPGFRHLQRRRHFQGAEQADGQLVERVVGGGEQEDGEGRVVPHFQNCQRFSNHGVSKVS